MRERFDAAVIGAGMSGLAAAVRLAHFGRRVLLCERHSLWGGLNSFYKQAGRRFDVGLHALTNWSPPGRAGAPLNRVLRQLRIGRDELALGEQKGSSIRLPGLVLRFSNDPALLEEEVARAFPAAAGRFRRFVRELEGFEAFGDAGDARGARAVLEERLREPLLVEALLLAVRYYGAARPDDLDWDQFVVLFRSIFLEGFARPRGGIKTLLDRLVARAREAGVELRMRAGVERLQLCEGAGGKRVTGLVLEDGAEIETELVLSSAGRPATWRLAGLALPPGEVGALSFFETITVLERPPESFGHEDTVTFFADLLPVRYRAPEELVDVASGVLCAPTRYQGSESEEPALRATCLASPARWRALDEAGYRAAKAAASQRLLSAAARHAFDPRPAALHQDAFTPRTIERFTAHANGAVYGSPVKSRSGATPVRGLFLCGTDQGLCGVVGALLSGILMANRHGLAAAPSSLAP